MELWPTLEPVLIRAGPSPGVQEGTTHSFPTQAKNFLHGLGINIKHTLKESPIHQQNYIELKTKGAILMRDVDERKEDDGRVCFDKL